MADVAKPAVAKQPAASKGDKAPAKSAAAATTGAPAAAVSLKQMAAGLAEGHDLPNTTVVFLLDASYLTRRPLGGVEYGGRIDARSRVAG